MRESAQEVREPWCTQTWATGYWATGPAPGPSKRMMLIGSLMADGFVAAMEECSHQMESLAFAMGERLFPRMPKQGTVLRFIK